MESKNLRDTFTYSSVIKGCDRTNTTLIFIPLEIKRGSRLSREDKIKKRAYRFLCEQGASPNLQWKKTTFRKMF